MRAFWVGCLLFLQASAVSADVVGETVEYRHGDAVLEGYLAYDDATETKRPAVIVVHEWKGLGDYAKRRANQLAELGYVAFAADVYGKGVRPQTHEEAGQTAGLYKKDRGLMRGRINAALDVLKQHPFVEPSKIAAIGYCFGGTTVLELARSGADVKGVASFHGALSTPDPADAKNIKGKVLVLHGAEDKFVPAEEVEAFKKEMKDAGVDLRFESYPGAVHSFTVAEAGSDPSAGMAYDAEADKRSWETLRSFLKEIFA
jgi:dienelactone hydrolase